MLHPAFPIETERLRLRPYLDADRDWLMAMRHMPEVMALIPFGDETGEAIERVVANRKKSTFIDDPGDAILLIMEEKAAGARVGELMLRYPPDKYMTGEIGFMLHPDFQGKGYAFEGAMVLMRLGFDEAKFHRIMAITEGANTSCRTLLKRLGLREEAYHRQASWFKGAWHDDVIAAMLAEEWQVRTE